MAELNQLEAMQELEKHLSRVKRMQADAGSRTDAATMAKFIQVDTYPFKLEKL